MKTRLAEIGGEMLPSTPAHFGVLIANETEKWSEVVRTANIKPERLDRPAFRNAR